TTTNLLDYDESELIGKSVEELLVQETRKPLFQGAYFDELMRTGGLRDLEVTFRAKEGRIIPISLSAYLIRNKKAKLNRIVLNLKDITELKRFEKDKDLIPFLIKDAEELEKMVEERTAKFKKSEELYRGLYESSIDGIASVDMDENFVECNQAFVDMLGYTKEEVLKLNSFDIMPKKWQEVLNEITEGQVIPRGYSDEFEIEYTKKGGKVIPVSLRLWAIKNKEGKPIGRWGIVRDITERKKAQEAIKKSEEKYSTLVEKGNDGIIIIQDGMLKFANSKILEITGFSLNEALRKSFIDFISPEYRGLVMDRYRRGLSGEIVSSRYETEIISKDDKTIPVEISASLIEYGGRPANMAIIRDITERKQAEDMQKQYSEQLEELVKQRTDELRNAQEELVKKEKLAVLGLLAGGVAHELRNPLAAIKNAAYFLAMVTKETDSEIKDVLEILEMEVAMAEKTISDLLDFAFSKRPIRVKVNINDVIYKALSRIAVPENIAVLYLIEESLPTILADSDQLIQVFGNIVLNAVQAMSEGGQLIIKSEFSEPDFVIVSFIDTGAGIPEENLTKIFEPLFTTKAKGIGLGLAIIKILVEAHQGSIEVESELGQGSTFKVKLPVEVTEE
ncbi:MAG: PAS domain S-box protein, partial [Candidatus Sifarchaeia archaeon]